MKVLIGRYVLLISLLTHSVMAQFTGPVGSVDCTAIHADSAVFVGWVNNCVISRGWQDISNPPLGYASVGDSSLVIGKAGTNGVVSLGDGGYAICEFSPAITNGQGADFAVFENAFNDSFLELAFVEVSSDGINYVRFPATSNTQTATQLDNAAVMNASNINNLAGKYRNLYGTPFDLEELIGNSTIDVNHITHVKVIDIVGSLNTNYVSFDMNQQPINDPWPTPFPSSGFDLDAIGVIHQSSVGMTEAKNTLSNISLYPNPCIHYLHITSDNLSFFSYTITNTVGSIVMKNKEQQPITSIDVNTLEKGIYYIELMTATSRVFHKFIKL